MAEPLGIMCILTEDVDDTIARTCTETAVIETGSDEHAAVLVCHLGKGHDGDLHHDSLDGLWWRADEARKAESDWRPRRG
jgi:hypothetical protein